LNATRQLASSRLITSCAALAALFVFMPMGERVVAAAFEGSKTGIDRTLVVAFLLNIALILFAWRRSKDLQNALAANEAAQQSAHDNAYIDHVTGLAERGDKRVLHSLDHVSSATPRRSHDTDRRVDVGQLIGDPATDRTTH